MAMIKCAILFFIFIISTIIGKYLSNKYVYRLSELEEIKNTLNVLKSKIKFTYEPIPEIFMEISKNASLNISKIFSNAKDKMKNNTASDSWRASIDEYDGYFTKEDKEILKTLSKLLRRNRCRWAIESNRNYREFFTRTNKTSPRRKK